MSDDTTPEGPATPDPDAPRTPSDTPGSSPGTPGARSPDPGMPRPEFLGPHVPGTPGWPPAGATVPPGTPPGHLGGAAMPPAGAPPYGSGGAYGGPPYGPGPVPPRRGPNRVLRWAVAGAGALVLFVGAGAGGAAVALHYDGGTTLPAVQPAQGTSNKVANGSVAAVAKAVLPSVVSITVPGSGGEVQGSGVIIKSNGTIVTNNHVVADAANGGTIKVRFSDGRTAEASIAGRDPSADLAVIRAKGVSGLKAATFADSGSVQVGDSVIAIGSPLGLNGSVTSGIVSALHRSVTLNENQDQNQGQGQFPFGPGQSSAQPQSASTVVSAIQTDAAINPGNSGGPLLNSAGQVIGINTAIASASDGTTGGQSGNIGVGFAIPSSQVHDVAQQLVTTGKAEHAYLGVSVADPTSSSSLGAFVAGVESGSPAAKAGLKKGDVITKADGNEVGDAGSLVAYIRGKKNGDKVTLTYTRGGSTHTATVTLSQKPG